jgi:hypothetical protein
MAMQNITKPLVHCTRRHRTTTRKRAVLCVTKARYMPPTRNEILWCNNLYSLLNVQPANSERRMV